MLLISLWIIELFGRFPSETLKDYESDIQRNIGSFSIADSLKFHEGFEKSSKLSLHRSMHI